MDQKVKVAIVGSTGYGGVELIRLLLQHPYVEIRSVISSSTPGVPITDGYPHLSELMVDDLDAIDVPLIKEKADLVFLATPAGVASELAPKLLDAGLQVIDLSGDFRLKSGALYEAWYKRSPASDAYLAQAFYGLSDIYGADVRGKKLISNPGCYATTALLGLIPVISAGWIDRRSIVIDAKSGVSGAGRAVSLGTHYAEVNENFSIYKVNKHQHIPEIEQVLGQVAGEEMTITFSTHLVPMTRGIMCTMYAGLLEPRSEDDLIALYRQYYEGRSFVRIRNKGKWPATKEVWGSNYCDIGFAVDERTGRVTIISVSDNMVKGAAGQAIQNLNLMMGWDEREGLNLAPVYP